MSTIHVGNAPCSWGMLEFEGAGSQPIGAEQMLDELAQTGYSGTELGDWGFMPTEPAALRAELARRSLSMLGAFVPVRFVDQRAHADGVEDALRVARLLAAVARPGEQPPFVVLADDNAAESLRNRNAGRITPEMGLNAAQWRVYSQGVEQVARAVLEQTGLRCVFHHHCAGWVETPDEIARLLEGTDPQLVGLVFDTGHYAFGAGGDCAAVQDGLQRFGDRIWYMHFKDCHPQVAARGRSEGWDYFESVRHGIFCELGQGCVDFPAVISWLRERDYRGWIVVEQDVLPGMGSPRESAQRNRDYLRSLGL